MTWQDQRVVFRDVWADDLRLFINGRDVTEFRGVNTTYSGYQRMEPFAYGPATFRFESVDTGEIRHDHTDQAADLRWLRKYATAVLFPLIDGELGKALWRGFIDVRHPVDGIVEVGCAGEMSGRLGMSQRQQRLFYEELDLGLQIYQICRHVNVKLRPRFGAVTGIRLPTRGSGESNADHVVSLLADTQESGSQYTIGRHSSDTAYEMRLKDRTTVHCTVFYQTDVQLDVVEDIQEAPNTFYGSGFDPSGRKILNGVYPNLRSDQVAPPYPMAGGADFGVGTENADTLTGEGITLMHWKLIGTRYMPLREASGTFDAETANALRDLQRDADLPVTGDMDLDTWDALYDVSSTGFSVGGSEILPFAQDNRVRRMTRTATGNFLRTNPRWDPSIPIVSRTVQHGVIKKRRIDKWSENQLDKATDEKNWVGTLRLQGVDVWAGEVTHAEIAAATEEERAAMAMSRFEIEDGMNVLIRNFDGDTLFHIGGNNVDGDGTALLAIDTQARDLQEIGAILDRNRESRRNRGREFRQSLSSSAQISDSMRPFSEIGGILDRDVEVTGGQWNVIYGIVGGQEGEISFTDLQIDTTAYYWALFSEGVSAGWLNQHIGDPSAKDANDEYPWATLTQGPRLYRDRILLGAWGTVEEPCGYADSNGVNRRHTKDDGTATSNSVTGRFTDDAGYAYRCTGKTRRDRSQLVVAVWPINDGTVRQGRVFKPLMEGS